MRPAGELFLDLAVVEPLICNRWNRLHYRNLVRGIGHALYTAFYQDEMAKERHRQYLSLFQRVLFAKRIGVHSCKDVELQDLRRPEIAFHVFEII